MQVISCILSGDLISTMGFDFKFNEFYQDYTQLSIELSTPQIINFNQYPKDQELIMDSDQKTINEYLLKKIKEL